MIKIVSQSASQTRAIASKFALKLRGGEILALIGDLGSGKTTFVKGLAYGLGIKKRLKSPTFVILVSYPVGKKRIVLDHFDLYRLKKTAGLEELGFSEISQDPRRIVAIEWAQKAKGLIPKRALVIKFQVGRLPNERVIIFS